MQCRRFQLRLDIRVCKLVVIFRLDLLVEDQLILELKSVEEIRDVYYKPLRTYLKLMNKPVGWLINFGEYDFAKGMRKVTNTYYCPPLSNNLNIKD